MKTFEIDLPKAVYFGLWCIDDNKVFIDEVHTFDEDEKRIDVDSIDDKELFQRIYAIAEKKFSDEILSDEEYEYEVRNSMKEDLRD